jgi:hypothetical protein
MNVRVTEKILAKPEVVFNFISNPQRLLGNFYWAKDFNQSVVNPNQFTFSIKGYTIQSPAEYRIEKVSKNKLISSTLVSSHVESSNTFQLFPDQDGTILCVSGSLKFKGILNILRGFFPNNLNQSAKSHLFMVKQELESKK